MIFLFLIVLFFEIPLICSFQNPPQPCFLKCKDNYLNGMQFDVGDNNEWSIDMVTPINISNGKMGTKLIRACRRNEEYVECLRDCPNGKAKEILLKGQNVWGIICNDFRNDSDFRAVIVPCWSQYGREISQNCEVLATCLQSEVLQILQAGPKSIPSYLETLCKSIYDYDKCFIEENFTYCGSTASRFLVKLNHQTSHTILDLLDKSSVITKLPKTCKDWLNQKGMSSGQKSRTAQRKLRNSSIHVSYALIVVSYVISVLN